MTVRTDPSLVQRILSDNAHQPLITPTQWIVHTAVDGPGPTNLGDYFENHTNLESHEWLRWNSYEQFIWYDRSADANYKVNHWWNPTTQRYEGAVSTETEDDGDPVMRPWNDYQLKQLIRGGVWKHKNLGIPVRLCRSVHDPGMGWHCMFPNDWTNVPGKTCPGSTRIEQFKTIVLPGIQKALAQGDDMAFTPEQEKDIATAAALLVRGAPGYGIANWAQVALSIDGIDQANRKSLRTFIKEAEASQMTAIKAMIDALPAKVVAALPPASGGTGITPAQVEAACAKAINDNLGFLKPGT